MIDKLIEGLRKHKGDVFTIDYIEGYAKALSDIGKTFDKEQLVAFIETLKPDPQWGSWAVDGFNRAMKQIIDMVKS